MAPCSPSCGQKAVCHCLAAILNLADDSSMDTSLSQCWLQVEFPPPPPPHHWFGRPVICALSPTMTCQWASASSGLWCNSDLDPMLCPLSRAGSSGLPSRATFAGALSVIHKLWAMNSMLCLIAPISVRSGPSFLAFSRMLPGACVCSCGTRTRNLSAIVSLPCCKGLRHEHDPVLISQAG